MKKDLKGLRINKRFLGRVLSIALAGVLTVTSCYFAPARAIADDGEPAVETAAPEEVQQPAEEAPVAEETVAAEAPAADAESPDAAPAAGEIGADGAEAGESGEAPAEGQEGAEVQPAEGGEGTAIDPETGEVIDPEQDPLAEG